jgi:hypothetical protein
MLKPGRRHSLALCCVAAAVLAAVGCSTETEPEQEVRQEREPVDRETPGGGGSSGEGGGRELPDGDIATPGPDANADAGTGSTDVRFDPSDDVGNSEGGGVDVVSDAPYSEREINVPVQGFAPVPGTLFDNNWVWQAPTSTCSGGPGSVSRYASVYRLTTTSPNPVAVEIRLLTADNSEFVSLADGVIHLYSSAGPWETGAACLGTGTPTSAASSALSAVPVTAGAPVWIVVTSTGAAVDGSYDLVVGLTSAAQSTDPACADSCPGAGNGVCQDGGRGSEASDCASGSDCSDCGSRDPSDPGGGGGGDLCEDTCLFAFDGSCDDGGDGFGFGFCDLGTDCSDCGPRAFDGCAETCSFAADGECDDGGPGSFTSLCELGTDCIDCGPR